MIKEKQLLLKISSLIGQLFRLSETRRDTRGMLKSIEDEQLYNDNLIRGKGQI